MNDVSPANAALFILSSGGYSTVLVILISLIIAVVAFVKDVKEVGYLFLIPPLVLTATILMCRAASSAGEISLLMQVMRHLAVFIHLFPYGVVFWMMVKFRTPK